MEVNQNGNHLLVHFLSGVCTICLQVYLSILFTSCLTSCSRLATCTCSCSTLPKTLFSSSTCCCLTTISLAAVTMLRPTSSTLRQQNCSESRFGQIVTLLSGMNL